MKKVIFLFLAAILGAGFAYATPCDEVISMIAEKIKANNVTAFTLEAVEKGTMSDKKVVGVCGEGTKDILYQRGDSAVSEAAVSFLKVQNGVNVEPQNTTAK